MSKNNGKQTQNQHQDLLEGFQKLGIPNTHSNLGISNLIASDKLYKALFSNRRLPENGWSDIQIQHFLFLLSTLDTNNKSTACSNNDDNVYDQRWCGVGEREGRVYSSLVSQRHYGLSHGIGRSGDITEAQPKAAGSSVLARLTLALVLDAVRRGSGLDAKTSAKNGILLPLCTGMSMSLVLSTLLGKRKKHDSHNRIDAEETKHNYCVLWCRIDQKSCLKAIITAGLRVVVIPTTLQNDEVVTDMGRLNQIIELEKENVVAIISTTSCFAPRIPDPVDKIATLCQSHCIPHVINNAYGLQCKKTCKLINRACVKGRVDAIVFSMDKNFLVPVGGAVILSPTSLPSDIGNVYAGRASSSPIVDLFITLLSMGLNGYRALLLKRQNLTSQFECRLKEVAQKYGARILECPNNTISFGITLDSLLPSHDVGVNETIENDTDWKSIGKELSYLGSMLFTRCVSGTRVVPRRQFKAICDIPFNGFGSSVDNYPHAYLTTACAIGLQPGEMEEFMCRLDKTMKEFVAKQKKKEKKMRIKNQSDLSSSEVSNT